MKIIATFMMVLFLSACGGSGPNPKLEKTLSTDAFIQVPSDTVQFYYASAQGENITLAKNNALAEIASRISVSISSFINNSLSVNRDNGIETSSQDIKSRVNAVAKTIEFSGVSVNETQKNEEGIWILIKVDRKILYQSYLKKLSRLDLQMKEEMTRIKKASVFYQLKLSYALRQNLQKAEDLLVLLEAMNPSFNDKTYRDTYARYEKSLESIKKEAIFSISFDKHSASLASLIKEKLSSENIKISKKSGNVRIKLSTKIELKHYKSSNAKISKMKIVIRTTTIRAIDTKGVSLSNTVIRTKAASSISKEEAISQTKQYEKLIEKEGILSFLSGNS